MIDVFTVITLSWIGTDGANHISTSQIMIAEADGMPPSQIYEAARSRALKEDRAPEGRTSVLFYYAAEERGI
jgi:hypothetical protein